MMDQKELNNVLAKHKNGYMPKKAASVPTYGMPTYSVPTYGVPTYSVPTYSVPTYGVPITTHQRLFYLSNARKKDRLLPTRKQKVWL